MAGFGAAAQPNGGQAPSPQKAPRHKSTCEKHADTELQESTPQQLLASIDYFPSRSKGMLHQPNSHLLRRGRHSESGRPYLITAVVHNRQPLFKDFHLGRLLVAEFRKTHELGMVDSLAWVVMPDHFHWLFELQGTTLSQAVGRTKSRSTLTINRARGSKERFWQLGYHDRAVRSDEDLRKIARYIIANPLRAGLVEHIGDYPLWDAAWL